MAERIKGLQIDLSMKDMGIGATLAGVRRSFKTLNSDLKLSRNNFKNSEKSMTSYKNRIRELDGATKQQRNNVKELRAQYQKTAQEQGANSAKAARLRTEYNKQADTLNYLEHELEQTTSSFKNFQKESQAAARVSNSSFGRLGKSFTEMGPKINKVGESMKSVGRSMSMYVTAPVVAGFAGAVKASIDYEQALAGVAKTTDLSGKKLQSMSKEITNMSNTLPFTSTEIAGVAEAAGQLGVKKSEITDFTRTMLDMSVATNLTSEEAATEFARFANAAGMPISDVDRLGSAVVALGNSTATTEKEIVEMGQRLAGAGSQAGFSSNEIMSISAAMSSVGIEAEAGGTAMTQIFNKMTKASAEGGEELNNFAKVSGMSATEFAQTWENNPTKALSAFVKGLGNTEGGAKGVLKALDGVGITGIREADTIRRMSNNHGILNKALKTGEKGWKDNSALSEEAETRYKTLASQLKVLRNNFVNFGRSLGDTFGPTIGWVAEKLSGMFKYLQTANPLLKGSVVIFGTLAAAIGPLALVVGVFTASLGSIMTTLGPIMVGITKAGGILKYFSLVAGNVAKVSPILGMALKGIGSAATFMLGPWGLVIAGVVALGTALVVAYKKSETFRNIVNGALQGVIAGFKLLWTGIMMVLTPVGNAIASFGRQLAKTFGQFWAENGPQFMQALNNIKTGFMVVWSIIKPIISGIGSLFKAVFGGILSFIQFIMPAIQAIFRVGWALVKYIFVSTWEAIKGVVNGGLKVIMGVIQVFSGLFTGNFKLMWSGVKNIFFGALQFVWNLVQLWFVGKIFGVFKLGFKLIKSIVSGSLGSVKGTFTSVLGQIWGVVKRIFTSIWNFIKMIFSNIAKFTRTVWNNIKLLVTNPVRGIYNIVTAQFRLLSKIVRGIFSALSKVIGAIWRGIRNTVVAIAKGLYNTVRNRFQLLKDIVSKITRALGNALKATWNWIKNTIVGLARGLYNTARSIFSSMSKALRAITSTLSRIIKSIWSGLKNAVVNTIRGLLNTAKSIFTSMRKALSNITQSLKNAVTGKWKDLKKNVVDLATGAKDGVVNGFKAMYNKGVEWLDKLKGFIKNAKDGFKSVATDLGKGVANGAISGLNAMIDGINTLSDKIMSKKLIKKKIPKLSTGTGANPGVSTDSQGRLTKSTKAIVNDKGIGNASGSKGHKELIYRRSGKIEQPRGNNKRVSLKRGDAVYNGMQSKALLPHLSTGTLLKGGKKRKKDEMPTGDMYVPKNSGNGGGNAVTDAWDWTKDKAKKAKDGFGKAIGDVWDYAKNPGKLITKVMKHFGVDFSSIKGAMGGVMDFGYSGLKKGLKELVTGWFDDSGGDGDSGYLDLSRGINFGFARTASAALAQGYPFARAHHGIDVNYPYGTKVLSTTAGTATGSKGWNGGFGNMMSVKSGIMEVIYGHLSKLNFMGPKKVKPGDELGLSGGDPSRQGAGAGSSTGSHLHYEMKWNGRAEDPMDWLKKNNGGGKGGGKYGKQIKQALGMAGLPQTSKYIKAWQEQARTESTFNPKARNPSGASGLVQVKPGTFNAFKLSGHGDIWNPLDNLIAGMRYAKATYGPKKMLDRIGHGLPYKTGGIINSEGMYNLAEDGHSEVVVPLDPARANDAMKLIGYAQSKIKDKKNKRPNQVSNNYGNQSSNDAEIQLMQQQLQATKEQNNLLMKILGVSKNIEGQPKGFNERDVSQTQGKKAQMMAYNMGGAF